MLKIQKLPGPPLGLCYFIMRPALEPNRGPAPLANTPSECRPAQVLFHCDYVIKLVQACFYVT